MIVFDNWVIRAEKENGIRQFDNNAVRLNVSGDLPEGWTWTMLVKNGKNMDVLSLTRGEGDVGTPLTAELLSISGFYSLQLRGKRGDVVRHTNVVTVYVEPSLSGDVQWPAVPGEFSALERRINEKVEQAEGYSLHPPVIGENGTWWTWDGMAYADTGKPSRSEELTEKDKGELVDAVLAALPDGDEVSY